MQKQIITDSRALSMPVLRVLKTISTPYLYPIAYENLSINATLFINNIFERIEIIWNICWWSCQ